MNNTQPEKTFLSESQKMGKASEKIKIEDFEQALSSMTKILVHEAAEYYREIDESEFPKTKIALYCHTCREIVPAGESKGKRSIAKLACGKCKSTKISRGKIESLKNFYHIKDEPKKNK